MQNTQAGVNNSVIRFNIVENFIRAQKKLMKDGYAKEKAFEIVEKQLQDRLSEKVMMNRLTQNMAINNKARSFMTVFQQQAVLPSLV
jgi:hypothetical protein